MTEIQSAEALAEAYCFEWDTWIEPAKELANLIRARDKAIVERIREKIDKHGIITRQWQLNSILDDVLREIGGE